MYDKESKVFKSVPVKVVAQEREYYSDEDEQLLSKNIEGAGHNTLDKLRSSLEIDQSDLDALSSYIGCFLYRVPHKRILATAAVPKAIDDTITEYKQRLISEGKEFTENSNDIHEKIEFLESKREIYKAVFPNEVIKQIKSPWPSERIVTTIRNMYWRFLRADGPSFFTTSDNPVFLYHRSKCRG